MAISVISVMKMGNIVRLEHTSLAFWDPSKAIDIGEWSICGGGRLDRLSIYTVAESVEYGIPVWRLGPPVPGLHWGSTMQSS